jgi:hypothetical protein
MIEYSDFIEKYKIYIIIFIIINILYFGLNIEQNDKFKTLISFYGSLSIFISMYSLLLQINQSKLNRISNDIIYVNKIFSDIDNDIYSFFETNNNMVYYYNELYSTVSNYDDKDRKLELEKIISYKILSNSETIINYIDSLNTANGETNELKIAELKLKKLLSKFLKSKIFNEYWKEYRDTIAMNWTKDYFEIYF